MLQVLSRWVQRHEPVYSSREAANLRQTRTYVMGELLARKTRLYKLYLDQCSGGEYA